MKQETKNNVSWPEVWNYDHSRKVYDEGVEIIGAIHQVNNHSVYDYGIFKNERYPDDSHYLELKTILLKSCTSYEGYLIQTDRQDIYILISADNQCCENFGYLSSDDDLDKFRGARLFDVVKTNTNLLTLPVEDGLDEGDAIFVTLKTDKGDLQFAVYNGHNGYYGHGVIIYSEQLSITEVI
jgi:hypothetical protein